MRSFTATSRRIPESPVRHLLYHACETLWQVRGGEGNARSPEAEVESKGQIEMLEMEMHRDKLGPEETQINTRYRNWEARARQVKGQGLGTGQLQDFVNVRFATQEAAAGSQAVALLRSCPVLVALVASPHSRRTVPTLPSKPARFSLMASRLLGSIRTARTLSNCDFQPSPGRGWPSWRAQGQ